MIISCFTCKEEFISYWNLMNHRKQKHPTNRTCRYFLKNECSHGVNCWYRHDEPMETDPQLSRSIPAAKNEWKCNLCDNIFENSSSLRAHRRGVHGSNQSCSNFTQGKCQKSEDECLFNHMTKETQNKTKEEFQYSDFQFPSLNPFPPDQA